MNPLSRTHTMAPLIDALITSHRVASPDRRRAAMRAALAAYGGRLRRFYGPAGFWAR